MITRFMDCKSWTDWCNRNYNNYTVYNVFIGNCRRTKCLKNIFSRVKWRQVLMDMIERKYTFIICRYYKYTDFSRYTYYILEHIRAVNQSSRLRKNRFVPRGGSSPQAKRVYDNRVFRRNHARTRVKRVDCTF